jgi:dihydrofolate reductase
MTISLIVAVSENNIIGRNNQLPWHLPDDMKFFKDKTMGHCVIMGRKNYDSIPEKYRPLSGRTNIVITRTHGLKIPDVIVAYSLNEALEIAREKKETECFIIGGGEVFKQAITLCDKIYLTRIHHRIEGDVYFPELIKEEWREVTRTDHPKDEKHAYDFSFLEFKRESSNSN